MNEYGDSQANDQARPIEDPTRQTPASSAPPGPQYSAPTWQWTGTQPAAAEPPPPGQTFGGAQPFAGAQPLGGAQPLAGAQPFGPYGDTTALPPVQTSRAGSRHSRRGRILGGAAALLLVGGAAAGGAAFGFAHAGTSSSASGIASGGSGVAAPASPGQTTAPQGQTPSQQAPSGGQGGRQGRGGRPSSYIPPGHATAAQQIGVVDINTKLKYEVAKAAGTGMILTSDGEILTNNHVVEGATKIKVTIVATGKKYDATVVGTDKVDDVAVLQLTGASGLSTVKTDTTNAATIGDAVTAVGNAMGAGGIPSAAKGSVVGVNRSITTQSEAGVDGERLTGMIQVNAQVIAGDSGGPLFDANNEVIGMDTAASSSPTQSVGFAIPITKALSIAQQIQSGQAGGNITLGVPGFLGVQFQPGSTSTGASGAQIAGVVAKTPAASLNLIAGDRITNVSGTAITSGTQLKTVLAKYRGGDKISLTWSDSQGQSHTATVTLIDGPAE